MSSSLSGGTLVAYGALLLCFTIQVYFGEHLNKHAKLINDKKYSLEQKAAQPKHANWMVFALNTSKETGRCLQI